MRGNYTLSDVGLRLIKSYEGFRPVDVELASGQRVVGYGHRVFNGKAVHMSKAKAEDVLRSDLAPYIEMVNDKVFAPISQGQFDALVSLAFNIGPKRFEESDVLRALNNGRVLDAANGFDVWRRAKINGESYVVDALVRRRTAEKILFLRPEGLPLRAPRLELQAAADAQVAALQTHAGERIYEEDGFAQTVPYEAQDRRNPDAEAPAGVTLMRRREDHARSVLMLSEVYDEGEPGEVGLSDYADDPLVENTKDFALDIDPPSIDGAQAADIDYAAFDPNRDIVPSDSRPELYTDAADLEEDTMRMETKSPSAIAAAAAEVSGRLDALMAGGLEGDGARPAGETGETTASKVLRFPPRNPELRDPETLDTQIQAQGLEQAPVPDTAPDTVVGSPEAELAQGDSASRFIEMGSDSQLDEYMDPAPQTSASSGPLSFMFILGMILGGASLGAILSGYAANFGVGGEFAASIGAIFGLMLFLGSVYYIFKSKR